MDSYIKRLIEQWPPLHVYAYFDHQNDVKPSDDWVHQAAKQPGDPSETLLSVCFLRCETLQ